MNHSIPNQVTGESPTILFLFPDWSDLQTLWCPAFHALFKTQLMISFKTSSEVSFFLKTDFQNFLGKLQTRHPTFKYLPKHLAQKERNPVFGKVPL